MAQERARVAGKGTAAVLMGTTAAGTRRDLPEPAATTTYEDGGGLRIGAHHYAAAHVVCVGAGGCDGVTAG